MWDTAGRSCPPAPPCLCTLTLRYCSSASECHLCKMKKNKKTKSSLETDFLFLAYSVRCLLYKEHKNPKKASRSSAPVWCWPSLGWPQGGLSFGDPPSRCHAPYHGFCLYWEACTQCTGNSWSTERKTLSFLVENLHKKL